MCSNADQVTTRSKLSSGAGSFVVSLTANSSATGNPSATCAATARSSKRSSRTGIDVEADESFGLSVVDETEIDDAVATPDVGDLATGEVETVFARGSPTPRRGAHS